MVRGVAETWRKVSNFALGSVGGVRESIIVEVPLGERVELLADNGTFQAGERTCEKKKKKAKYMRHYDIW